MPPTKILNLPVKGTYDDRVQSELTKFGELIIKTENPSTVLLLLEAPENDIVLEAIAHLDNFIDKLQENALMMYSLKIVEKILELNLLEHTELFIRRFSLKIISKILQIDNSKPFQFPDYEIAEKIFNYSKQYYCDFTCDFYIVEYSAVALVGLLNEPRIYFLLESDKEFMLILFDRLRSTKDTDILCNTYLILLKLIRYASADNEFCSLDNFPLERLFGDMTCEYPEIQLLTLDIILELTSCQYTDYYKCAFICQTFFDQMITILLNSEKIDVLVVPVLKVLQKLMDSEDIAKIFTLGPSFAMLINFTMAQTDHRIEAISVFCEISKHDILLNTLYQAGILNLLLDVLKNYCMEINASISLGIKRMLNHAEAFIKILDANPVPCLITIIQNEMKSWDIREAAADCLQALANRSTACCEEIYNNNIARICEYQFNKEYGVVSADFLFNLLQILMAFAKQPELRTNLMNESLCESIVNSIKKSIRSVILLVNFLNAVSALICEDKLKEVILKSDVCSILLPFLNSPALIAKTSAADFIILTGKFTQFSDEYIDNGVLEKLLLDEKSLATCTSWSLAIEAILSSNLSLKFCVRQRLGFNDVIETYFHLSKMQWNDFNIFRNILKNNVSPLYPLIIVSFVNTEVDENEVYSVGIDCSSNDQKEPFEEWVYCRRPPDRELPKYLLMLRDTLEVRGLMDKSKQKNTIDITNIADRARVIAEIVCSEMCGTRRGVQTQCCSEHVALNHLNYLKCGLHCNIIPLGMVKFGSYFERAALFKALADQIGLPCSLQRSVDGRLLYNEIPVPTVEKDRKGAITILPRRLLHPTHIIDLMDNPGDLYLLNSQSALQYLRLV